MNGKPICMAMLHPIGPSTPLVQIYLATNDNIAIEWI